jgi:hypothetical protein
MPRAPRVNYDPDLAAKAVASAQAVRSAADRAQRDLTIIGENQSGRLTAGELSALSTVRGLCAEVFEGERPVG